ncbi:MAG: hypothetical protein HXY44_08115 [Syntrophaceae bacterium]|nr:hypothetical protein [Syntrophaceae bacterium]
MPNPKIRTKTTTPARRAERSIYRSQIIQAEEPTRGLALEKPQNVLCLFFGYVKANVSAVGGVSWIASSNFSFLSGWEDTTFIRPLFLLIWFLLSQPA